MDAWAVVAGLWIAFGATHTGLSSGPVRGRLVARLGPGGFLGAYSALAIALFVPLVWVYLANRHSGPLLWSNPLGPFSLWVLYVAMGIAFVLMVAGLVQPSPVALGARPGPLRGVHRITRHALFMGTALFGALHLVPNGFASDVAFFAGFPAFALVGCWHQDRRKLASEGPAFHQFVEQTSFLPFARRGWLRGVRELPLWVIGVGIASTVALRWLHAPLFR